MVAWDPEGCSFSYPKKLVLLLFALTFLPTCLACLSSFLLRYAGEEVAIAAAILDLFWRLPRTAVKFLESQPPPPGAASTPGALPGAAAAAAAAVPPQQPGLVVLTIQLEEKLSRMPMAGTPQPRMLASAYREPLLRFLNK
jgi:hypothetical protein